MDGWMDLMVGGTEANNDGGVVCEACEFVDEKWGDAKVLKAEVKPMKMNLLSPDESCRINFSPFRYYRQTDGILVVVWLLDELC